VEYGAKDRGSPGEAGGWPEGCDLVLRPSLPGAEPRRTNGPARRADAHGRGIRGLDWQVDEYSRRRAATALAAIVRKRMAGASVAREMERAMTEDGS
jgi:hypothetical protein